MEKLGYQSASARDRCVLDIAIALDEWLTLDCSETSDGRILHLSPDFIPRKVIDLKSRQAGSEGRVSSVVSALPGPSAAESVPL